MTERGHLTADDIHELARHELPELSRATVYNSLAELVRVGLLQTVEGLGAVHYDTNLDPDHHQFHSGDVTGSTKCTSKVLNISSY